MSDNQSVDSELKALNTVYDELSKDARTIARDLNETVEAYFVLGFYLVAFAVSLDIYMFLTNGFVWSDYGFVAVWIFFVNVLPITAGSIVLYRYRKLSTRYKSLFKIEKHLLISEWRKSKKNGHQ